MTESKRCAKCNQSKHYACYKGKCTCKCQLYEDKKTSSLDEEHTYTKESQERFEEIMDSWRNAK